MLFLQVLVIAFLTSISCRDIIADKDEDDWSSWDHDEEESPKTRRWNRQGLCDHDAMTSVLLRIILDIQDSMQTGDPSLGVPPLDPLSIPKLAFKEAVTKHRISIKGELMNIVVRDLSTFSILEIRSDFMKMEANISLLIDKMTIKGDYKFRGIIHSPLPILLIGNGEFLLAPKQAKIAVFSKFGYKDGILELMYFDFEIKLADLFVKFDGIWGAGRNFNAIITSFGLRIFNKLEPKIHDNIRKRGVHEINKILVDLKYDEEFVMELLQVPLRCIFG